MACWDLLARTRSEPLHSLLGGNRTEILSGVSLGIESSVEALLDLIARYLEEGYRRIKLKIAPGWDVEVVRRVRDRYPAIRCSRSMPIPPTRSMTCRPSRRSTISACS